MITPLSYASPFRQRVSHPTGFHGLAHFSHKGLAVCCFKDHLRPFLQSKLSTPEGSPISSLLFLIYVTSLHIDLPRGLSLSYIDDFTLSAALVSYRMQVTTCNMCTCSGNGTQEQAVQDLLCLVDLYLVYLI